MRKLCSIVLAIALAVTIIPIAAVNASAATVLTQVDFTVTAPSAGATSAVAPDVKVKEKNDYSLEWAGWSTAEGYEPEGEFTFEEGETYYMLVKIKASDAYDFYYGTQAEADFIGEGKVEKVTNMQNNSSGYSFITFLVSVVAGEAKFQGMISNITLDAIAPPGRRTTSYSPNVTTPANKGYSVTSADWCDSEGNLFDSEVTFVSGETYYINVILSADNGCWWNQLGTLQTAVNGGEFVSYLNILNKNPGISTASLVISVVAEDVPENIILDVDLGFTPPGSGSEIKFDHSSYHITAIPSPETYITFPENSEVKYSSYWSALWCHEDGDSFSDDFTVYGGTPYYMEVALRPVDTDKRFNMQYTQINIENAEVVSAELEYGTLYVVFTFTAEPNADDCQVLFDPNTGTGSIPGFYAPADTSYTLPDCPFKHDTATFKAWLVDGEEKQPGDTITITGNTIIKAIWTYKSSRVKDETTDGSTITVITNIEFTDPETSEVTTVDLSTKTEAAKYGNPFSETSMEALIEQAKQDLAAAAPRYGLTYSDDDFKVTGPMIKNTWDNRKYTFESYQDEDGNYHNQLVMGGDCGHEWQVTFSLTAEGTAPARLIGDVNNDNSVDVLDAALVQKYASGKAFLNDEQLAVGDVNGDNSVDILDATEIQKFAAGTITEFKNKA